MARAIAAGNSANRVICIFSNIGVEEFATDFSPLPSNLAAAFTLPPRMRADNSSSSTSVRSYACAHTSAHQIEKAGPEPKPAAISARHEVCGVARSRSTLFATAAKRPPMWCSPRFFAPAQRQCKVPSGRCLARSRRHRPSTRSRRSPWGLSKIASSQARNRAPVPN